MYDMTAGLSCEFASDRRIETKPPNFTAVHRYVSNGRFRAFSASASLLHPRPFADSQVPKQLLHGRVIRIVTEHDELSAADGFE